VKGLDPTQRRMGLRKILIDIERFRDGIF